MSAMTRQPVVHDPESPEGPIARFREYLRGQNLRMTPERRTVLEVILSREGHFDAEELLRFLRRKNQAVSRATLYRTLDHLLGAGLVKMHRFGRGHALYEHIYGRHHHDHMVCDRCRRVIEFMNEEIERLQDEVCEAYGFRATNHVMQIFGICDACREKETTERS
jgi:Fur family transcriptional regulator, ferric uptake regulator